MQVCGKALPPSFLARKEYTKKVITKYGRDHLTQLSVEILYSYMHHEVLPPLEKKIINKPKKQRHMLCYHLLTTSGALKDSYNIQNYCIPQLRCWLMPKLEHTSLCRLSGRTLADINSNSVKLLPVFLKSIEYISGY